MVVHSLDGPQVWPNKHCPLPKQLSLHGGTEVPGQIHAYAREQKHNCRRWVYSFKFITHRSADASFGNYYRLLASSVRFIVRRPTRWKMFVRLPRELCMYDVRCPMCICYRTTFDEIKFYDATIKIFASELCVCSVAQLLGARWTFFAFVHTHKRWAIVQIARINFYVRFSVLLGLPYGNGTTWLSVACARLSFTCLPRIVCPTNHLSLIFIAVSRVRDSRITCSLLLAQRKKSPFNNGQSNRLDISGKS